MRLTPKLRFLLTPPQSSPHRHSHFSNTSVTSTSNPITSTTTTATFAVMFTPISTPFHVHLHHHSVTFRASSHPFHPFPPSCSPLLLHSDPLQPAFPKVSGQQKKRKSCPTTLILWTISIIHSFNLNYSFIQQVLSALSTVIPPFAGFFFQKACFLGFFFFTLKHHFSYEPGCKLSSCAWVAHSYCLASTRIESRSELFKKDTRVRRKVSGNSREVISYLLLPQQATTGKNFLFPCSDDVYLPNAAGMQ